MRTLSADERETFREQGFVVLPDVLDERRIALLRAVLEESIEQRERFRAEHPDLVAEMTEAEARGEVVHATEWTHVVMQMYQLWERIPQAREHSLDPVLGELARDALGVGGLRLWFDQAMVKPPGGGPTPYHQDNPYMPLDPAAGGVVTIWSPLTSVTAEMGCLRYLPGSHRRRRLPPIPLVEWDDVGPLLDAPDELNRAVPAEIPEGGVVVHHGDVVHGATGNSTDHPRPAVLTCYFPEGSRRAGPHRQYVVDRAGIPEGGPLVDDRLPVVAGSRR